MGESELLDASAAKHKLAVRPKKNHPRGKSPQSGNDGGKSGDGGERLVLL